MHVLLVAIQNWNPHCLAARALSNISCEQFVCSSCCCFGFLLSLFLSFSVHTILCKTYKAYQVYFLVQCSLANNLSGVTSIALHAFHGFVFIHTTTGISAFPTTVLFLLLFFEGSGMVRTQASSHWPTSLQTEIGSFVYCNFTFSSWG